MKTLLFLLPAMAAANVHAAGVVESSLGHGENLIAAMFTGYKHGRPAEAITQTHPFAVAALLAAGALCAWWFTR